MSSFSDRFTVAMADMAVVDLDNCLPERRPIWTDKETRHFLNLLIECQITQHLELYKHRNAGVFQALESRMRNAGYNRTYNQLRIKWKNMKKSYVEGRRAIATGVPPYTACPFYDELHQLLKDQPSRISHGMKGDETGQAFDTIDLASNASDCREDFEDHHNESAMALFNHFAESTSAVAIKKEHSSSSEGSCGIAIKKEHSLSSEALCTSRLQPFRELSALQNSDPDQLFLAMILPDIRKLSDPKKRRVKMDIQKLLDEALTEEDQ